VCWQLLQQLLVLLDMAHEESVMQLMCAVAKAEAGQAACQAAWLQHRLLMSQEKVLRECLAQMAVQLAASTKVRHRTGRWKAKQQHSWQSALVERVTAARIVDLTGQEHSCF
jgi:hypothetical protein